MGNYGKYGQYDDGNYSVPENRKTENARQFDEQIAASKETASAERAENARQFDAQLAANEKILDKQLAANEKALNAEQANNAANRQHDFDLMAAQAQYGGYSGGGSSSGGSSGGSSSAGRSYSYSSSKSGSSAAKKPALTASQAVTAIKNGEYSQTVIDAYNYYYGTDYTVNNPPSFGSSSKTDSEKRTIPKSAFGTSAEVISNLERATKKEKPALTASQAATAIKNGEYSQTVIDAYNYYYGTDYTVNNPPSLGSGNLTNLLDNSSSSGDSGNSGDSGELSDKEVEKWVKKLNKNQADKYDLYAEIQSKGNGNYKVNPTSADYVVTQVLGTDSLTNKQKAYLLYDKLGISQDRVYSMMNDKHYK